MLQRPAALLSDVTSRLWGSSNSNSSSNGRDKADTTIAQHSTNEEDVSTPAATHSSKPNGKQISAASTAKKLLTGHHIPGWSNSNDNSSNGDPNLAHKRSSSSDFSIAPPTHREKTALHALRDTFVFPSPSSFIPTLPTIPCMSGLGQSNIFNGNGVRPMLVDENDQLLHSGTSTPTTTSTYGASVAKDSFKKLDGNVLMLGGYRGSILRDAETGRRLWVPLKVGFNVRKAELAIGLTDEDERRTTETVVPGKALAAIAGFVDLGKRLKDRLKQLDKEGQIHFHGWGYDWRRSLELSSAELLAYVEKAKAETGKPTLIVAHSMGGLVALHALAIASDPTVFKGIIFGSTPFNGTPNILQPFKHGDSILMNKDICSPSTVFSFRSSFYLLPSDGVCFHNSEGKVRNTDFLDPSVWTQLGLSPMTLRLGESSTRRHEARHDATQADDTEAAPLGAQQLDGSHTSPHATGGLSTEASEGELDEPNVSDPTIQQYLTSTLGKVRQFHQELSSLYDTSKRDRYPPLVIIHSRKTATVKGCMVDTDQDIIDGAYERLVFGEGDGIILHASATALPEPWKAHLAGTVESSNGHVSILSDLASMRQAIDLVYQHFKLP